jgi:hypothetical protein
MVAGYAVLAPFIGTVMTELPNDTPVVAHYGEGLYATTGCILAGRVSARYIENPEDIVDPERPLYGAALVEIVAHGKARSGVDVVGQRMRRDPKCNGFYIDATPAWRRLIGW